MQYQRCNEVSSLATFFKKIFHYSSWKGEIVSVTPCDSLTLMSALVVRLFTNIVRSREIILVPDFPEHPVSPKSHFGLFSTGDETTQSEKPIVHHFHERKRRSIILLSLWSKNSIVYSREKTSVGIWTCSSAIIIMRIILGASRSDSQTTTITSILRSSSLADSTRNQSQKLQNANILHQ